MISSGKASPAGADDDDLFLLSIFSSINAETVPRTSCAVKSTSQSVREEGIVGDGSHSQRRPNQDHLCAIEFVLPAGAVPSRVLIPRFVGLERCLLLPRERQKSCDWLWLPARHIALIVACKTDLVIEWKR